MILGDFNMHTKDPVIGAVQDFIATMANMGLSQISSSNHEDGHMLDLVLLSGQSKGDLEVEEIKTTLLSWSDHFLVRFTLVVVSCLSRGGGPY